MGDPVSPGTFFNPFQDVQRPQRRKKAGAARRGAKKAEEAAQSLGPTAARRRRRPAPPLQPQAVGTKILSSTLGDTSAAAIGTKTLVGG